MRFGVNHDYFVFLRVIGNRGGKFAHSAESRRDRDSSEHLNEGRNDGERNGVGTNYYIHLMRKGDSSRGERVRRFHCVVAVKIISFSFISS